MMERTDWPTIPAKYFTTVDGCSCPDFQYRRMRTGQDCKHQKSLRQALKLIAANTARWAEREATD